MSTTFDGWSTRGAPETSAKTTWSAAPVVEFLLVGGGTLLLYPLAWLARRGLGIGSAEFAIGALTFYAAWLVNDPHFTVTYVLFYKDVKQRALGPAMPVAQRVRFVIAGFVVPIVLAVWAASAIAAHDAQRLGWMVQLMFFLVGWHYVKQGYGVFLVLCARRGVIPTAGERLAIVAQCFAGWAFAWANPATAAGEFEEKGVVYWAPARPRWLELTSGAVLAVTLVALVVVLAVRFHRERRTLPLVPVFALLVTIWCWTIFSSADPLVRYVIPALHSVQYLYFVWLLKRNEARAEEGPPTFGRPVALRLTMVALSAIGLAVLVFHLVPDFLDAAFVPHSKRVLDGPLGEMPFVAAFFVVVNIHHYAMDWVVWRRDNADTRFLRAASAQARSSG